MKFAIHIKMLMAILFVSVIGFSACEKQDLPRFDPAFTGIYFQEDSVYYSFGVTPLEKTDYILKLPVRIMGEAKDIDREFSVQIDASHTTAIQGKHFELPETFTVQADSVNAYIPVRILRDDLGDADFRLALTLQENNDFRPVNEPYTQTRVHFNNRVEKPSWKDYWGDPAWPDYKLGDWNPTVYIKFIELFREVKEKSPVTYQDMIAQFGEDLEHVDGGWPWDYDYTMVKYVLIPLYQFFMVEHGGVYEGVSVNIPKPAGI